jgi:hypothetical protein
MLLRLILLSFRDLSGVFFGIFRIVSGIFSDFQDVLDVDLSSLFIVRESPHRV